MKLGKVKVEVTPSPVIELLSAMHRVLNHEIVCETEEYGKHVLPDIDEWFNRIRDNISEEMLEELKIFFNKESFLGFTTITHIIKENCYHDIHQFLNMLHKLSLNDLFWSFTHSGFSPDVDLTSYDHPHEVIQYIDKLNLPQEEKWKLSYLIFDGERTKQRFIQLIEGFYYQHFKVHQEIALEQQEKFISQFISDVETGNMKHITDLIELQGVNLDKEQELLFIPSYYLDNTLVYAFIPNQGLALYGIGVRYFDLKKINKGEKETLEAIKLLTDERRFKVIQMLKKQAYYGYELAQALNVSNSTISHHLSALQAHRLVKAVRVENKVYFELNKDELQNIIRSLESLLLDD